MGLLSAARRGIRAFHGSPHDFDRFSMAHIGKGEGAQAYGHGLYFAEAEDVARSYRNQTSKDGFLVGDGEVWNPMTLEHLNVRVPAVRGEIDRAIERARNILGTTDTPPSTRAMAERDLQILEGIQARGGVRPNPGRMYEVRINAEPEEFLDWDAPLSGQGQRIQEAFRGVPQAPDIPGQLAYYRMAGRRLQSPETSARLRDAGIPGIRYLDGNSRSAGDGSRNYVVFDDSLIEILRKYGLIGMLGGTGALGATQDGDSV